MSIYTQSQKGIAMNTIDKEHDVQAERQLRIQAEHRLAQSISEKELLLKEIHHRIKNNLQIASSLLSIQSSEAISDEERRRLMESQNRIQVAALIHEKLFHAREQRRIEFADYCRSLVANVFRAFDTGKDINLRIDIKNIFLDINTAIYCGLIINELVTNALRHGFIRAKEGLITIRMRALKGSYVLMVSNNGDKPSIELQSSSSSGVTILRALTDQLQGHITLSTEKNTEFMIVFPKGVAS